jgi:FlaA1/EpsC-like NDP-sugar epimerase
LESGRIGITAALKSVILILSIIVLIGGLPETRLWVIGMMDTYLTFFSLIFIRIFLIFSHNYIISRANKAQIKENLLIFDAVNTSAIIASSFQHIEKTYRIAGFLRFGTNTSLRIGSYNAYSILNQEDFNDLTSRYYIKSILFLNDTAVKEESDRLIRYCEKKKIRMLILPSIDELKEGKINYRNLPEVRIEDLLERDEIEINMAEIAGSLRGKVVMVTGAAGSIGSELCRQLCHFDVNEIVLFDCAETPMHNLRLELEEHFPEVKFYPVMGDVRSEDRVRSLLRRFHPQIIFHAAAYKHVPLMEENPCESIHTNVGGTIQIANLAVEYQIDKFIMISTDKAVNPSNVMGASKRLAEIYVQSLGLAISKGEYPGKTHFITTRFGNVLGSNGSVIPRFREQLAKGGPLTVTHPEITRYFMTIPEACRLVLEAAFMGKGNEIFVFDMGEPVKIAGLARRMIELAGLEPDKDIPIIYTGLRPGEKLYEELLATRENSLPTCNGKIFRAQVREYCYKGVSPEIIRLCEIARAVNIQETVRLMKKIVPEFKSKHSHFEYLDNEVSQL